MSMNFLKKKKNKTVWIGKVFLDSYSLSEILADRKLAEKWFDHQLRRFGMTEEDGAEINRSSDKAMSAWIDETVDLFAGYVEVYETAVIEKEEDFLDEYSGTEIEKIGVRSRQLLDYRKTNLIFGGNVNADDSLEMHGSKERSGTGSTDNGQ